MDQIFTQNSYNNSCAHTNENFVYFFCTIQNEVRGNKLDMGVAACGDGSRVRVSDFEIQSNSRFRIDASKRPVICACKM